MNTKDKGVVISLVEKARAGDKDAFEQIYRMYMQPIYRYIYFQVKSREEAQDLTAEVFTKAFEKIGTFKDQGFPVSSWLYKIARNAIIDNWKRKKPINLSQIDNSENRFAEPEIDYSESIDNEVEVKKLKLAMENLSEDQREVITLKYIDDLKTAQIAKVTGKTEQAVRAAIYRGLIELKKQLKI